MLVGISHVHRRSFASCDIHEDPNQPATHASRVCTEQEDHRAAHPLLKHPTFPMSCTRCWSRRGYRGCPHWDRSTLQKKNFFSSHGHFLENFSGRTHTHTHTHTRPASSTSFHSSMRHDKEEWMECWRNVMDRQNMTSDPRNGPTIYFLHSLSCHWAPR
jgi:hypothetical protein